MKVEDLVALSADEAVVAAAPRHLLSIGPTGARWIATLDAPVTGMEFGRWAAATADVVAVVTADPRGHLVEGRARSDGQLRFRAAIAKAPALGSPAEDDFVALWSDGADLFAAGPTAAGSVLARLDGARGQVVWRADLDDGRHMLWTVLGRRALVVMSRRAAWMIDRATGTIVDRFRPRGAGCRVGSWYVSHEPGALALRDLDADRPARRVSLQRAQGALDNRSFVVAECRERHGDLVALLGPQAHTLVRADLEGRVKWELPLPNVTLGSHRFIGGPWPERGALAGSGRVATLAVSGDAGLSLLSIDLDAGRIIGRAGPSSEIPRWTVLQGEHLTLLAQGARRIALVDVTDGSVRGGLGLDGLGLDPQPWHLVDDTLWLATRGVSASKAAWSRVALADVGGRDEAERWLALTAPEPPTADAPP